MQSDLKSTVFGYSYKALGGSKSLYLALERQFDHCLKPAENRLDDE